MAGPGKGRVRGRETALDMVRSLGLVLIVVALVAGFVGLVRQPPEEVVRTIDYQPALDAAREAAPFEVLAPVGLDEAWRATGVSYDPGPPAQWRLGFVSPTDTYAAVLQSELAPEEVLTDLLDEPDRDGQSTVDGRPWERWVEGRASDPDVAITRTGEDAGSVVVFGSGDYEELELFASRLR